MSADTSGSDTFSQTPADSPGRLIADARKSQSISPADLALRLRLETKVIKALERDDFENLPAPMFIKGYIRSIASHLDIDAAPILDAYAAHAPLDSPTFADFASGAPVQIGVDSTIVKVVTYGLCTTLILLIVMWWRSNYPNGEYRNGLNGTENFVVTADKADPLPYQFTIVEHDNSGWRINYPLASAHASTHDKGISGSPLSASANLFIATSSEAWVEVYDAAGNRLYYGMAKAQNAIEITGQSHYRLILGNAASITLRFNGENVDLGSHSRLGVARLELGTAPRNDERR